MRVVVCTPEELAALDAAMPSQHHEGRYRVQLAGQGLYLVARLDGHAVGHILLRWQSTNDTLRLWGISEPYVEALGVIPALRSRGVGTALMQSVEEAARQQGYSHIGLAVGLENTRARALYERLGYRDAERPPFEVSWSYVDESGQTRREGEMCVYLTKPLTRPERSTSEP